jgi:NAD(P)-dependent dehydrogenase (short-subunit alcohol dehydrogenase family)
MDVPGFALITGAASGIGRACAHAFINEGSAGVALLDVNLEALQAVRDELEANGSKLCYASNGAHTRKHPQCQIALHQVDVTKEDQVLATIDDVVAQFGRLDYVINAAGIAVKHAGGVAFASTGDWQRILDVNLTGTFYVLRAAAKIMLEQEPIRSSLNGRKLQRGSIVNFSSIQGVVGIAQSAAYSTTKHGIMGLTRSASEDYAKDGLRINAILPGYTETPLTTKNPQILEAMIEKVASSVPMQRMGNPTEIADGVLYLAGGRSSFVTGSALAVDGGYTSR